jgi:hypothetical protein
MYVSVYCLLKRVGGSSLPASSWRRLRPLVCRSLSSPSSTLEEQVRHALSDPFNPPQEEDKVLDKLLASPAILLTNLNSSDMHTYSSAAAKRGNFKFFDRIVASIEEGDHSNKVGVQFFVDSLLCLEKNRGGAIDVLGRVNQYCGAMSLVGVQTDAMICKLVLTLVSQEIKAEGIENLQLVDTKQTVLSCVKDVSLVLCMLLYDIYNVLMSRTIFVL